MMTQPYVAVLGIPLDENSSFMRGPAQAPPRIRQVLHNGAANLTTERGIDLDANDNWYHVGDLDLDQGEQAFTQITDSVADLLGQDQKVLTLGGDHSITYPIMRAYAEKYPNLTIVQLDAHPDLYDELDGNRRSHACPFARIMENGLAQRLIQIGIRTMNAHQQEQA
ncbi:MAG: arginase family protein, partial [Chloroflexota bacterium]